MVTRVTFVVASQNISFYPNQCKILVFKTILPTSFVLLHNHPLAQVIAQTQLCVKDNLTLLVPTVATSLEIDFII